MLRKHTHRSIENVYLYGEHTYSERTTVGCEDVFVNMRCTLYLARDIPDMICHGSKHGSTENVYLYGEHTYRERTVVGSELHSNF